MSANTRRIGAPLPILPRLVKVTDWANRETAYSYDANGRLIETLRPNGTKQTRAYDAKGQLLQQVDTDAAGNVIAQFGFTYDASGDISEETGVDAGLTSLEGLLSLPEMTYGPGNRLATYNGESVQFDADGNMTHGPLGGAMADFVYDSRRRLTQAGTTQYVYDAENNRIGVNGTRFVVNSQPALSQVLVKTAADGTQTFYVYGLGLIGEESAAGYKAYHFDFRGSTVALSDASGAVLERYRYSAYGVLLAGDASVTPFLFNGLYGVMTDGNRLYHMRARFYSAEIRRFLNRDVLLGSVARGQSLNRFAFVTGKPVSLIDPFGLLETAIGTHIVDDNFQAIQELTDFISSNYPELMQRANGNSINLLLIPYLSLSTSDYNGLPFVGMHIFDNIFMPTEMCKLDNGLSPGDEYTIYTTFFHEFLHPYIADRVSYLDTPNILPEHILRRSRAILLHEWIRNKADELYRYYRAPDRLRQDMQLPRLDDWEDIFR